MVSSMKSSGDIPARGAPNCASAAKTAFALRSSVRLHRSISLVVRGSRWTPSAKPPITRYSTLWALNARSRSRKSLLITARPSFESSRKSIRLLAKLRHGNQARTNRLALPIAVGLGQLFIAISDSAKRLFHSCAPLHQQCRLVFLQLVGRDDDRGGDLVFRLQVEQA